MSLIENLLALYKVDREVRELRSSVESAEIYLNVQQKQLDQIDVELSEVETRRKQHQAHIANLEAETGSIDGRIEHLRADLVKANTDREYSALLAEINTHKGQRSAMDDEELSEMESVEDLEAKATEIRERHEERVKIRDGADTELTNRREEIADQLATLEQERAAAAAIIPPSPLSIFDEVANDYEGESMAAIEIVDRKRKEYACGCCSLMFPIELFNAVLAGGEELTRCGACDRILYIDQATREAVTAGK